ncbi:hypothetical protein LTR36_008271 [Oleoguttula mirabilis]|uniref:Uncharacterized protein n=1 Tax=Oleoguttula mirabilis TaxID=1507867 RepID=A0AAV9J802_9PEZI|nr:hypothetical protein LTR36_008271 [Oleoguttula mirabilis]
MPPKRSKKRDAAGPAVKRHTTSRKAGRPAKDAAKPSGVKKASTRAKSTRSGAAPVRRSRRQQQMMPEEAGEDDEPAAPPRRSRRNREATPDEADEVEGRPTAQVLVPAAGAAGGDVEVEPLPVAAPAVVEAPAQTQEPGVEEPRLLAEVEMTVDVEFREEEARFTTRLRVLTDPASQSRLAYNARYFLIRTVDDIEVEADIGYLKSWRIDKATAARPDAKAGWRHDILGPDLREIHGPLREAALYLQALFTKTGAVKLEFDDLRAELEESSLIFIELIALKDGFRGGGLLKHVMHGYDTLLATLPIWFSFTGSLILVPEKPVGHADAWEGVELEDVEKRLVKAYESRGFTTWADNLLMEVAAEEFDSFRIMRRTLP